MASSSSSFLQGHGVTNYNLDRPSYAFTAETTEFDDQLIRRNIVTLEQAIMAKGASRDEAQRLAASTSSTTTTTTTRSEWSNNNKDDEDEDAPQSVVLQREEEECQPDDDVEFRIAHRQARMEQLRRENQRQRNSPTYGDVVPISRPEWTHHVNDASIKSWVVVCLTADSESTGCMEYSIAELALKFTLVKFVTIHHHAAIPNWPEVNLPSLFLYRHGKMQHQLVSMSCTISPDELEWKLAHLSVLETTMEEEPRTTRSMTRIRGYGGTSTFGGTMASLATQQLLADDDNENYDDVD